MWRQHGDEAVVQGAQGGTRAWDGTLGQDLQGGQQGVVVMQCVCGEGTMQWRFDCFVCGLRWEEHHKDINEAEFVFSKKKE